MPIQDWRELRYQLDQKQKGFKVSPEIEKQAEMAQNLTDEDKAAINQYLNNYINLSGNDRHDFISQAGQEYSQNVKDVVNLSDELDSGYGEYRKDKNVPFEQWITDPVNYRANEQTNGAKLANGILKAIPYAGTTYIDNTIGLLDGLLVSGPFKEGSYGNNFINSWTGEAMQKVRDWSDRVLPNYRTQQELDDADQWWKHLNANFWGDTFIKNLGFTIGAGLSGATAVKGFRALQGSVVNKAYKAAAIAAIDGNQAAETTFTSMLREGMLNNPVKVNKVFNAGRKSFGRLSVESQIVGGMAGAVGESRVEALQAAKEFRDPALEYARSNYARDKQLLDEQMYNLDNGYAVREPIYDGYGEVVDYGEPVLTEDGKIEYSKRLAELQKNYQKEEDIINKETEKLAKQTFWLNMPVLTASDIVMFGRMFSGGLNTQAKVKLRGKPGAYQGIGSATKAVGKGFMNATTEGLEELTQKMISEGSKDIAESNIASFHNGKYDTEATRSVSEWLMDMGRSASGVLTDNTSWEEFAVGFLTGALGMPTRGGWSGGIIGGIQSGLAERDNSREAAKVLNERIADPRFKTLWEGLIRHNAFENQKDEALNNNNSFAWHSANDKQLVSDIMMFSDAGRLKDLEDSIDSFAQMTPEEAASSNIFDDSDPDFNTKTDEQKAEWVKKRADEVKKTINRYRNIREGLDFASFGVPTDTEAMNELIYTQATLLNMADRYDSVLNEALSKITPVIESKSKETTAEGEPTVAAVEASGLLTDIPDLKNVFLGYSQTAQKKFGELPTVYLMDNEKLKAVHDRIDDLIKLTPDEETKNNLKDLHKIINTGKTFYERLYSPEFKKTFAEQFEKQAKTDQKAAEELKEQVEEKKVNESMNALEAETGGMATVEQMHRAYDAAKDKEAFMKGIVKKAKTDEEADRFVKLRKTYDDFREALKAKHPELIDKKTGQFNLLGEVMLHDIVNNTTNVEQFLQDAFNIAIPRLDAIGEEISMLAKADDRYKGYVESQDAIRYLYGKFYNAIQDTLPEFKKQVISVAGKENIVQAVEEGNKTKEVVPQEESPAPAVVPEATPAVKAETTIAAEPEHEVKAEEKAEEAEKEPENEPVDKPDLKEVIGDSLSTFQDTGLTEEQSLRRDDVGRTKSGIYQNVTAEVGLTHISRARNIVKERKNAGREEMELLDNEYNALDLSNFVQFDEEGKAFGKGVTDDFDYSKNYKYLEDNNAFEYRSLDVDTNDEIVFAILPNAPLSPEGQKQIVWGKVKSRNADGEITAIQPIDFLHSRDKAGRYMNLDELYDAIQADYESADPESLYIFGGKKNPKTSKVFQRRPGIVRYDKNNTEGTKLNQIPAYREDAPIMIMDKGNRPVLIRGNAPESNIFMPNVYEWSHSHDGRVYYLAKGGSDKNGNPTYTPIFVDKMPITKDKVRQHGDNKFLTDLNDGLDKIDKISKQVTPDNIEDSNIKLKKQLSNVIDKINLDGISFEYVVGEDGNPELKVGWQEVKKVGKETTLVPAGESISTNESVFQILDKLNRPARVSYNPKWIDATKKNIQDIIDADLLRSNAQELRQVEVNLWYDPWNSKSGKFERILPDQVTEEPQRELPEAEPQRVATEPKTQETEPEVQKPEDFEAAESAPQPAPVQDSLEGVVTSDYIPEYLDYDELDEDSKAALERNGYTKDDWDTESDDNMRRHMLNC